ncbi:NADH-quinone oxidoreductase subunit C [Streptomyces sp. L2]|uniref:NADH-quinone oxidoreductase subunit C n=1 Tax=Streptomyces sp. L2 TaxID=2162665 RepID=UPI0010130508|nr:NADH-quinone oxidoreductase subunit C [Streptomyces sp. L2]
MSTVGWLPAPAEELFGADATAEESYEVLTVDVPSSAWLTALDTARTTLSCTYFDWLSAVDEPGVGFRVSAHVAALHPVRRLLVRTTVPHEAPTLPSAVGVYAGAAWHERETHEMFGITFDGHPALDHLLLPDNFEGHPLRKDFVLAARVAKAWPGAKEPGESDHAGPKRRQMLPPGVPDPNEWGPLKGQLPPAPARPARGAAARTAGDRPSRAPGERPARRTRTAAEGSTGQARPTEPDTTGTAGTAGSTGAGGPAAAGAGAGAGARPRRTRSASEGSVSQAAAPAEDAAVRKQTAAEGDAAQAAAPEGPAAEASVAHEPATAPVRPPRRARTASDGSAAQRPQPTEPTRAERAERAEPAAPTEPTEPAAPAAQDDAGRPARRPTSTRSSDAPWHHARPAFDEQPETERQPEPQRQPEADPDQAPGPQKSPEPEPEQSPGPRPEKPAGESPKPSRAQSPDRTPDDPAGGPQ